MPAFTAASAAVVGIAAPADAAVMNVNDPSLPKTCSAACAVTACGKSLPSTPSRRSASVRSANGLVPGSPVTVTTTWSTSPISAKNDRRAPPSRASSALRLCERDGYQQVTIKAIADVGRQTVYRWWPDKAQVLLDALIDLRERELSKRVWETDDPLRDVRNLLEVTFALTREITGKALVGLLAAAQDDPELSRRLQETVISPRRDALRAVLQRGVGAGVFKESVPLPLVVDFAFGTMWYRMLHGHAPVDAALAGEITDAVALLLAR